MKKRGEAKYRVGVIGCGRAGTGRARAFDLHPQCRVAAIADTDPENLALGCERFGVPGYSTYEKMFAAECIDIAMPVLPVSANAAAVIAAAEAGVRAIFCEKPLTASLADADRMVEVCRSRGVHLGAGVMVSSHRDYIRAYELVTAGEIGQVSRINLHEANKQGGCHGLNLLRKFAGKAEVKWVSGWVAGDAKSDFEEPYEDGHTGFGPIGGHVCFANGIHGFCHYDQVGWQGIEIVGSCGTLYNWNNTAIGLRLRKGTDPGNRDDLTVVGDLFVGEQQEKDYDDEGWMYPGDVMMGIVDHIVRALEHGTELPITTGDDLRHALEIAIALRESARRTHAPISLPLLDRQLVMYPEKWRWHYKKNLWGREKYMEQMKGQKR